MTFGEAYLPLFSKQAKRCEPSPLSPPGATNRLLIKGQMQGGGCSFSRRRGTSTLERKGAADNAVSWSLSKIVICSESRNTTDKNEKKRQSVITLPLDNSFIRSTEQTEN